MLSFEVRPLLRTIKFLPLIVAVCASRAGIAQSADDSDFGAELTRIIDSILEARAEGGTYAKELIAPLTDLSALYRERGNYSLEAVTLDNALQVVRANYGLRSLEQAPLIRQRISSEESVGNFAEAWQLERELLALVERHPDDLRIVPILHEIGDKRMELFRGHVAGERPPQVILGCFYEQPGPLFDDSSCTAGGRSFAARQILVDAQRNYAKALGVLRHHQEHAGEDLDALESKLYRNSYFLGNYGTGRRSLVRRIFDDAASSEPPLRQIARLVELADWDLLYGQRSLAFDLYAETYSYLEDHDVGRARIHETFSPVTPVVLPAFLPDMLASERAQGATGYVDVEFDVTRYGTTRRIRVLDTHDASRAAVHKISRWLVDNRFRPNVTDLGAVDARFVVRHYVHE